MRERTRETQINFIKTHHTRQVMKNNVLWKVIYTPLFLAIHHLFLLIDHFTLIIVQLFFNPFYHFELLTVLYSHKKSSILYLSFTNSFIPSKSTNNNQNQKQVLLVSYHQTADLQEVSISTKENKSIYEYNFLKNRIITKYLYLNLNNFLRTKEYKKIVNPITKRKLIKENDYLF